MRHRVLVTSLDVVGQDIGERLSQNPFLVSVPHLHLQRDSHRKKEHLQIKIRNSSLNTKTHAASINPLQLGA